MSPMSAAKADPVRAMRTSSAEPSLASDFPIPLPPSTPWRDDSWPGILGVSSGPVKNLLSRVDHPTDRRVYLLDLTRPGRALVEDLQAIRLAAMEGVLTRMSLGERRRVLSGLETLV